VKVKADRDPDTSNGRNAIRKSEGSAFFRLTQPILFLKDNNVLVELIYVAPDEMYDTWLSDFSTLVHTFSQVGKPEGGTFHALIGVPDAALVREVSADYEVTEAEEGSSRSL
jgi:hypothetical protein